MRPEVVEDTIVTANIAAWLPPDDAARVLERVARTAHPSLLALQEFGGPGRGVALRDVSRRHRLDHARPEPGAPVVMWDRGRYAAVSVRARTLSAAGWVGRLPGRRSSLPRSRATVAVLDDALMGRDVTLINAHLTAEVQRGRGYRRDLAHRLRVTRHQREVRRLGRIARRQRRKGRRVYIAGDSNFDGLRIRRLISCWRGRRHVGTLGSRAVDIIFAPRPADDVRTIDTASDHRAVVATYRRRA